MYEILKSIFGGCQWQKIGNLNDFFKKILSYIQTQVLPNSNRNFVKTLNFYILQVPYTQILLIGALKSRDAFKAGFKSTVVGHLFRDETQF